MTLVLSLSDVQWGTDELEGHPEARRLNLMDPKSGIVVQVIFGGDPLENLVKDMAKALTNEHKQNLIAELTSQTSGLIIPNGKTDIPAPEKP